MKYEYKEGAEAVPTAGETYYHYDDGRPSVCHQYTCKVVRVIPWDEIPDNYLYYYWTKCVTDDNAPDFRRLGDPLYDRWTDYIVIGRLGGVGADYTEQVYTRTTGGGWYSLDNCYSGRLDVSGNITRQVEEYNNDNNNETNS